MNGQDAATRTGVSYRQVDYWLRRGFLSDDGKPSRAEGSGYARSLTVGEYARLERMARLVRAGVDTAAAAKMARAMVETGTRAVDLPGNVRVVLTEGTTGTAPTIKPDTVCVCGTPGIGDYEGPLAICDVHGQPSVAYDQGHADARLENLIVAAFTERDMAVRLVDLIDETTFLTNYDALMAELRSLLPNDHPRKSA